MLLIAATRHKKGKGSSYPTPPIMSCPSAYYRDQRRRIHLFHTSHHSKQSQQQRQTRTAHAGSPGKLTHQSYCMADWQEHGFSGRPFLQLVTLEKSRCGETGKRIDACGMECGTGDRDPKQLACSMQVRRGADLASRYSWSMY